MGGYVARMGEIRMEYETVSWKPEGKRFRSHRLRWEDDASQRNGLGNMDSTDLAQDMAL